MFGCCRSSRCGIAPLLIPSYSERPVPPPSRHSFPLHRWLRAQLLMIQLIVHELTRQYALRSRRCGGCGMIAGVSGIYDEPELYELACAYRDIPAEVTALLAWCATHVTGGADQDTGGGALSVLELAAGPAEHARELARRELRAASLDLSPAMCSLRGRPGQGGRRRRAGRPGRHARLRGNRPGRRPGRCSMPPSRC